MGVHSEIIVLLYPVAWLKSFVFHEKHENKWPWGPFPLLPSSALRETYRGKEKSDSRRKQQTKVCQNQTRIEMLF